MFKKKLTGTQQKHRERINELVQITIERGITSADLQPLVRQYVRPRLAENDVVYNALWEQDMRRAVKISAAGRAAQLSWLIHHKGFFGLRRLLMGQGSTLDGFVRSFDTSPVDEAEDIGWQNINEDGDVI